MSREMPEREMGKEERLRLDEARQIAGASGRANGACEGGVDRWRISLVSREWRGVY